MAAPAAFATSIACEAQAVNGDQNAGAAAARRCATKRINSLESVPSPDSWHRFFGCTVPQWRASQSNVTDDHVDAMEESSARHPSVTKTARRCQIAAVASDGVT